MTVDALAEILDGHQLPGNARQPTPGNPFAALDDRPVIHPYAARRYAKAIGHEVPLEQAVGNVAAESVEVYPPGIPLILEGFRVSRDAVTTCARRVTPAARSSLGTRLWRRLESCSAAR